MIFRKCVVAGLVIAISAFSAPAIAYPITSITISLPANPDAKIRVTVSDATGDFRGRVSAPAGVYIVSADCGINLQADPAGAPGRCDAMHITSLMVDGIRVAASPDGTHQLAIRSPRQSISISGTVAPETTRPRRR